MKAVSLYHIIQIKWILFLKCTIKKFIFIEVFGQNVICSKIYLSIYVFYDIEGNVKITLIGVTKSISKMRPYRKVG